MNQDSLIREIRHGHLFCGLGGGAKGFNRGKARVGNTTAKFRCLGGIDVDAASIRDFGRLAGVAGTVMDLFDRDQYVAFHGREPASHWREAMPSDIVKAMGNERPHIWFLSAPCKGFSGLLSETKSLTTKYQALNRLTLRGIWLALEAYKDDPVEMIVFENVPRIATRGRHLLDQIVGLLKAYGYAVAETTHDCGELGGLAQSRKRFLLVARHHEKVPPFLYEPEKRSLRAVGDVLGRMPMPGVGGPMHRIPSLQWKTWVRLAFVEAGSDWRSLNKLAIQDGYLRDFLIVPEMHRTSLGVNAWDESGPTITSRGFPLNGAFSVADPRQVAFKNGYGVMDWQQASGAVAGEAAPSNGRYAIADPRFKQSAEWHDGHAYGVTAWGEPSSTVTARGNPGSGYFTVQDPRVDGVRHSNVYRIVAWDEVGRSVTAGSGPSAGGIGVADPRGGSDPTLLHGKYRVTDWEESSRAVIAGDDNGAYAVADPRPSQREDYKQTKYRVNSFDESTGSVIAASTTGNGAFAVADPRPGYGPSTHHNVLHMTEWDSTAKTVTGSGHPAGGALSVADPRPNIDRSKGDHYLTGGHYGVLPWDGTSGAVSASANQDNGRWSVADPRLPEATDKVIAIIRARDGTWHRPFTTLELAALQSLVDPEEYLELDGLSDSAWRERIGNAVPPEAAEAIAGVMGTTLLLAWAGETFTLSAQPIWVRPMAVALSVRGN